MWLRAAAGRPTRLLPAYQRSNRPVETGYCRSGVVAHPLLILPPDVQRPASLGQAALRHPGRSPYRCFLPDLTGFGVPCRAGPSHQHQTINAVSGGTRPGGGIQPRCSGLRVQGTASTPSSTTTRNRIVGAGACQQGGLVDLPPTPSLKGRGVSMTSGLSRPWRWPPYGPPAVAGRWRQGYRPGRGGDHDRRENVGGEGGIRTHGTLRYTRSPGAPDRPLSHLSAWPVCYRV